MSTLSSWTCRPLGPQPVSVFGQFCSQVCFRKLFLQNVSPQRFWVCSCMFVSVFLVSQLSRMCPNHRRVVQKQGWRKYYQEATQCQLRASNVTTWTHLGVILGSGSMNKLTRAVQKKVFSERRAKACQGATANCDRSRDVRPRRPDGAFWEGKLKAGRQKTDF